MQSFYRNADEEEMWVTEKDYFVQSTDYGHDLNTAMILLGKHEVVINNLFLSFQHFLTDLALMMSVIGDHDCLTFPLKTFPYNSS